MKFSPRSALALFLFMVLALFAQALWWIVFMARLTAEKVKMAGELGGSPEFVQQIHQQEIQRQIMVGLEGVFFLVLILVGAWLIYRALVRTEELKFHQQNFLMAVTHELKTPLASIKLYLDTLQSPKIADERKEKVLPRMKEDVHRLEKLVENILDAGRFERHGYQLNKTEFDLSGLVAGRVQELSRVPLEIPVKIAGRIAPDIRFFGDPAALGRALDAVLENSLKYHNGRSAEVSVEVISIERQITITVADKGIGFDKNDSKSLFERFFRIGSEMTRRQSGSGLGLYLCREIVRAHGGDVTAESPGPGLGATFTITLKKS
jgi:signal transduction histidine kinase